MAIWVANKGDKDYSKALRHGHPIVSVFNASVMPDYSQGQINTLFGRAYTKLRDFDHEKDYLLLAGAPEAIAVCAAILLSRFPSIMTLKWDREGQFYYPVDINLERLRHGFEKPSEDRQSAP